MDGYFLYGYFLEMGWPAIFLREQQWLNRHLQKCLQIIAYGLCLSPLPWLKGKKNNKNFCLDISQKIST
jgi:hypothetical protein